MKNFFNIPVDLKPNEKSYYERFVNISISKKLEKELEDMTERIKKTQKKYSPLFLNLARISTYLSTFSLIFTISSAFMDALRNYIVLGPILFGVFIVLHFACMILHKRRTKKLDNSEEIKQINIEGSKLIQRSYKELGINMPTTEMDVCLYYYYRKENGKTTPRFANGAYFLKEYAFQVNEDCLILADIYEAIKIPLSSIKSLTKKDKKIFFYGWNKSADYTNKEYKKYNLRNVRDSMFSVKGAYVLEVKVGGDKKEIILPPYEEKIEKIYKEINKIEQ